MYMLTLHYAVTKFLNTFISDNKDSIDWPWLWTDEDVQFMSDGLLLHGLWLVPEPLHPIIAVCRFTLDSGLVSPCH